MNRRLYLDRLLSCCTSDEWIDDPSAGIGIGSFLSNFFDQIFADFRPKQMTLNLIKVIVESDEMSQ
jgi:hypothetical protein